MNSNEFVNWLKGYLDGCDDKLTKSQVNKLKETLVDVYEINCPQQIQPITPSISTVYVPPIGDQPYGPPQIWYTTNTGTPPSFGGDSEEYKH